MQPIDELMPTQEGRYIDVQVLAALLEQDVPFRLWISTSVSDGDYAKARNHIKQYAISEPYVLMLDNDVVMPPRAIKTMVAFLDTHKDFAAIALRKQTRVHTSETLFEKFTVEEPNHVDMSCVLFRRVILEQHYFTVDRNRGGCECQHCCDTLRAQGWRIGFINELIARHIPSTFFRKDGRYDG